MKKHMLLGLLAFMLSINVNAQFGGLLDKAKKKAEEKAAQEKKEAEKKAENKVDNPVNTSGSGSGSNSNTGNGSNSNTSNSNSGVKVTPVTPTPKQRKLNSKFPESDLYKNNIGKILMFESFSPKVEKKIEENLKNELDVNKGIGFYMAFRYGAIDEMIYPNGDSSKTGKAGYELSQVFLTYEFRTKTGDIILNYTEPNRAEIYIAESHLEFHDYHGYYHEDRGEGYIDLIDSIPNYKVQKWIDFINKLPVGKSEIGVKAWFTSFEGQYSTSKPIAQGEITLIKPTKNIEFNYQKIFAKRLTKRRLREINANLIKHEGITSETHKSNMNKIVFSKNPIEKGKESNLTDQFSATDNIFGRFYLDNTIKNIITYPLQDSTRPEVGGESFFYRVIIDDTKDLDYNRAGKMLEIKEYGTGFEKNTTHALLLKPDVQTDAESTNYLINYFLNCEKPGPHKVTVNIYYYSSKNLAATGSFTINKTAGQFLPFGIKLSESKNCKAGMSNPAVETSLIAAFKKEYEEDFISNDGGPVYTITKCVICDKQWTTVRNELTGTIVQRAIEADLYLKDNYGHTKLFKKVTFRQDYNGKTYGNTFTHGASEGSDFVILGK
ncbi:MAG: hypothetical protein JNJ41_09720 [Bacteroidia bacterium]|nr:hypothetical protein [Bacteroidia bacterium]